MLAALVFLAICIVVGLGLTSRLDDLSPETRGSLGFVVGLMVVGPAVYVVAYIAGGLSMAVSMGVVMAITLFILRSSQVPRDGPASWQIIARLPRFCCICRAMSAGISPQKMVLRLVRRTRASIEARLSGSRHCQSSSSCR